MPRIAAALGVLATVAFCIGFNLQRYPVVWQSLATAPNPLVEAMQSATVSPPRGAIASAIRPTTGRTQSSPAAETRSPKGGNSTRTLRIT